MEFTLKDGGAEGKDNSDICLRCENCTFWSDSVGDHKHCSTLVREHQPKGPVSRCNAYIQTGHGRWDFEKIAWVIEVKDGKQVGFRPPDKTKRDQFD